MQDKEIKCIGPARGVTCPYGATFIHSVKDQEFYAENGFQEPKRCRDCREEKKARNQSQNGVTHGKREFRDNRGGFRRNRDRAMFGYEGEE